MKTVHLCVMFWIKPHIFLNCDSPVTLQGPVFSLLAHTVRALIPAKPRLNWTSAVCIIRLCSDYRFFFFFFFDCAINIQKHSFASEGPKATCKHALRLLCCLSSKTCDNWVKITLKCIFEVNLHEIYTKYRENSQSWGICFWQTTNLNYFICSTTLLTVTPLIAIIDVHSLNLP